MKYIIGLSVLGLLAACGQNTTSYYACKHATWFKETRFLVCLSPDNEVEPPAVLPEPPTDPVPPIENPPVDNPPVVEEPPADGDDDHSNCYAWNQQWFCNCDNEKSGHHGNADNEHSNGNRRKNCHGMQQD